jgi:NhaP-type Na+/H+ or K+/H+ antiporter
MDRWSHLADRDEANEHDVELLVMLRDGIKILLEVAHDNLELKEMTTKFLLSRLIILILEGLVGFVVCLVLIDLGNESLDKCFTDALVLLLLLFALGCRGAEGICSFLCFVDTGAHRQEFFTSCFDAV